jgi:hypothetical protein
VSPESFSPLTTKGLIYATRGAIEGFGQLSVGRGGFTHGLDHSQDLALGVAEFVGSSIELHK